MENLLPIGTVGKVIDIGDFEVDVRIISYLKFSDNTILYVLAATGEDRDKLNDKHDPVIEGPFYELMPVEEAAAGAFLVDAVPYM